MCLAVPARIIEKRADLATVEIGGITRQASLVLLPGAGIGDYVLIHAGFAISLIDRHEARETLEMLRSLLGDRGEVPMPSEPAAGREDPAEGNTGEEPAPG
ncbi:MAG: HypC/HybG/HupF family hydrogenase formation chaperone [Thermoleophilia bacterium]|nr:HypC/HybG/HupF family hydrogenase formation chaperone [Thermoleophilia bacterium]